MDAYGPQWSQWREMVRIDHQTPVMYVNKKQPNRARWKRATDVTGVQPGSRDTDHWLGTPIIVQPRPYWISPGNVYFFHCPAEK